MHIIYSRWLQNNLNAAKAIPCKNNIRGECCSFIQTNLNRESSTECGHELWSNRSITSQPHSRYSKSTNWSMRQMMMVQAASATVQTPPPLKQRPGLLQPPCMRVSVDLLLMVYRQGGMEVPATTCPRTMISSRKTDGPPPSDILTMRRLSQKLSSEMKLCPAFKGSEQGCGNCFLRATRRSRSR